MGAYLAIEQQISAGSIFAASLLVTRSLGPDRTGDRRLAHLRAGPRAWRNVNDLLASSPPDTPRTRLSAPSSRLAVEDFPSPVRIRTACSCRASASSSNPARRWPSWGRAGRASRPWCGRSRGRLPSRVGPCASTAAVRRTGTASNCRGISAMRLRNLRSSRHDQGQHLPLQHPAGRSKRRAGRAGDRRRECVRRP